MRLPFVNRKKELDFLNEKYFSGSSELIIIYGRSRVGKTELIKQSLHSSPGKSLYFLGELQKFLYPESSSSALAGFTMKSPGAYITTNNICAEL